jgi:GldM C-terminal domain
MQNKFFFLLFSCISFICTAQQSHTIVATPATTNPLYKFCANKVQIEVPSKGDDFQAICRAKGGEITQSVENPHKFLLIPKENECHIMVADDQSIIGSVAYKVEDAPKPRLQLWVDGVVYDGKSSVKYSSKLELQVVPDANFQKNYSKDARYMISSVKVFAKTKTGNYHIGGANLSEKEAHVGLNIPIPSTDENWKDEKELTLIYEFDAISRKNFKGEIVKDERFTAAEKVFYVRLGQ